MLSHGSIIILRCGSITVYLSLEFNQNEEINKVLSILGKAVKPGGKGIGDFSVDPRSIQAISDDEIPSDAPPKHLLPQKNQQVKRRGES